MTVPLFLYGPMAEHDFLEAALGAVGANAVPEALLRDHNLSAEPVSLPLPGLASGRGVVKGRAVGDADAIARLLYIGEVLGLEPVQQVRLSCEAQDISACALTGRPGTLAWQADCWSRSSQLTLCEAVREIVEDMAHRPAADLVATRSMILSRAAARVAARDAVPAALRSAAGADHVEALQVETLHAGFFRTRGYHLRHPRFDGTASPVLHREVFVATDAALVLPYDPLRDRLLLIEQFRMGPYGRGDPRPWMLEPVAGRIDAGETPEETALRECREEARLDLRGLEKISTHYCTPGYSTEVFHLFLGLCDLPDVAQWQGGLETENEDIRSHVIDFAQAMALLHSGEANNGPLVLSLIWLERERARLRASA
ncbi:ADP-ribose pyrophosphatase [Roseovarius sp. A-2]|uniref:NUDIX domain-containing protein n=1 Tax=Roseovarius sp. A-2 TaxID=1570360 RepID=UPI0009D4DEAE|nr:NUDIX domain-containing protein [Roseovarius sp. A-2]GAW34850.1 ADP-ribose pyrophosphatase [Roseovarius sp. A-2]